MLQDRGAVLQDRGAVLQDGGAVLQDGGAVLQDRGAVLLDRGAVLQDGGAILQDEVQYCRTGCSVGVALLTSCFSLQGKRPYLDTISQYLDVHSTINMNNFHRSTIAPGYVVNHGILSYANLQELLKVLHVSLRAWLVL